MRVAGSERSEAPVEIAWPRVISRDDALHGSSFNAHLVAGCAWPDGTAAHTMNGASDALAAPTLSQHFATLLQAARMTQTSKECRTKATVFLIHGTGAASESDEGPLWWQRD